MACGTARPSPVTILVIALLRGPDPGPRRTGRVEAPTPTFEKEDFLSAVERVKGHIHAGDVFQLVLSIRMEGACGLDPFEVYRALRLLNPSPYMVYMEWGDTAVVGSSTGRSFFKKPRLFEFLAYSSLV